MKSKPKAYETIEPAVLQHLKKVGANIRRARLNRGYTADKLASLAGTNRETLRRLETGHPGVGIGYLASVLWALQLDEDLLLLAAPERDSLGQALNESSSRQRGLTEHEDEYDF